MQHKSSIQAEARLVYHASVLPDQINPEIQRVLSRPQDDLDVELKRFCAITHSSLTKEPLLAELEAEIGSAPTPDEETDDQFTKEYPSFQLSKMLGRGQAGTVYLGEGEEGNPLFAIKTIHLPNSVGEGLPRRRTFLAYQRLLKKIRHPSINPYIGWTVIQNEAQVYTQYCEGGSLHRLIYLESAPRLREDLEKIREITRDLLDGLVYLHSHGIVHRDIKPENILINRGKCKIVDFGCARIQQSCCLVPHQTKLRGTPSYCSPESVRSEFVYDRCGEDVWALGCCVFEMALGASPWDELDNQFAIFFALGGLTEDLPNPLIARLQSTPGLDADSDKGLLVTHKDFFIQSGAQVHFKSRAPFSLANVKTSAFITATLVEVHQQATYCILGTSSQSVQVWKLDADLAQCLATIGTPAPARGLAIGSQGLLVVSHDANAQVPLWSAYQLGGQFSTLSRLKQLDSPLSNYEPGRVRLLKTIKGHQILAVYETNAGTSTVEVFSTTDASQLLRFDVEETILDVLPHGPSLCLTLLLNGRLGRYIPRDSLPEESFDDMYTKLPLFEEWFSRDSATFFYKTGQIQDIQKRRELLAGELFFDKLLALCNVDTTLYPPKDSYTLERLFRSIFDAPDQGSIFKHCLVYYLLKDISQPKAEGYSKFYGLSRPFVLAIGGFWSMDHCQFSHGVQWLSDPAVDLDDAPGTFLDWHLKIITTLFDNDQCELAHLFIQSKKPSLWSQRTIEAVLKVLTKTFLIGALDFQRQYCKHNADNALDYIFDECFEGRVIQRQLMLQLLSLPLDTAEQDYLIEYCTRSKQTAVHDFLLNYFIQKGRYGEALRSYQELFTESGVPLDPKRQNLMKNIGMLVPAVQHIALGLAVPSYAAQHSSVPVSHAEPTPEPPKILSQDAIIREGHITQETVLQALHQNYLNQEHVSPVRTHAVEARPQDDDEMDVTGHGAETPLKDAVVASETPASLSQVKYPSLAKRSPATPFVQPPYTTKIEKTSPVVKPPLSRRESAISQSPFSTHTSTSHSSPAQTAGVSKTPLGTASNLESPGMPFQSPVPGVFQPKPPSNFNSPLMQTAMVSAAVLTNAPPLVSRSPFNPPSKPSSPAAALHSKSPSLSAEPKHHMQSLDDESSLEEPSVLAGRKKRAPRKARDPGVSLKDPSPRRLRQTPARVPKDDHVPLPPAQPASTLRKKTGAAKSVKKPQVPTMSQMEMSLPPPGPTDGPDTPAPQGREGPEELPEIMAATTQPTLSDVKDDDEFEDFELQDWQENQEDQTDADLWQESWDDAELNDEFSNQLRAELEKKQ
ncbi:Suppressor of Sensor Kinase (SLN1) [Kappamyces sp. JEL0829]|nr:Suppressor of Sensor Kinase (SLN1) [Kappamyces sp. JEL0829]